MIAVFKWLNIRWGYLVRAIGVEPTCLAAPDPKSGASASFATPAYFQVLACKCRGISTKNENNLLFFKFVLFIILRGEA